MAQPTARGMGLLLVAAGTYLAARVVGTWELYLLAFSFLAAVVVGWLLVSLAARRLTATRLLTPAQAKAGDKVLYSFTVSNGSVLPGLQVSLRRPAGELGVGDVELETLAPRGTRRATAGPWRARRGVHVLPPLVADAEDPLGLVCARRTLGEPREMAVYPRLPDLPSCPLVAGLGRRRDIGRHGRLMQGTTELRSIRPYNPGEPLSRVDWKSTARTGSLMLREMEDPTSSDIAVLLDGATPYVVGEEPYTSYELAVEAAGAVADFALRAGHSVTLLRHERVWDETLLTPDVEGHRRLLDVLARSKPDARLTLGPVLRTLLRTTNRRRAWRALIVVALTLDSDLVGTLTALRKEGLDVSVAAVDPASFTGAASPERPAHVMALLSAGVPCLTLARGVDLRSSLSAGLADAVLTIA